MTFKKLRPVLVINVLILSLILGIPAFGQPENPDEPNDTPVPLTGIELLLIAGGSLGGYKLFKKGFKNDTSK